MVFAFGWDNNFIIVQRHPSDNGRDLDETITEWYILVVAKDIIHGPLTELEYHQMRQDLGLPDSLDFSQTIPLE